MIKTISTMLKQDKEKFVVPKGVQDVIPIKVIYDDGIFKVNTRSSVNPLSLQTLIMLLLAVKIRKLCFWNTQNFLTLLTVALPQRSLSIIVV